MPTIRIYQPQVSPGIPYDAPQASPDTFGAGVGRAIEGAGQELGATVARAEAARAVIDRQRQASDANIAASHHSEAVGQIVTARQKTAAPDAAGYVDTVLKDFDESGEKVMAGLQGPIAQREFRESLAARRAILHKEQGNWAAAQQGAALKSGHELAADTDANTLNTAPSLPSLYETMDRNQRTVEAYEISPKARAELIAHDRHRFAASTIEGFIRDKPYEARAILKSGVLNEVLDADHVAEMSNRADGKIKGIEAQARQEQREALAEQHRQQEEAKRARSDAERKVADNLRDFKANIVLGMPVYAADVGRAEARAYAIGNPELARGIAQVGIASVTQQQLKGATPVQVQGVVSDLDAKINAAGAKVDPTLLIQRDAARKYLAAANTGIKEDTLGWAAREGVVALQPINPADPASFAARRQAVQTASGRFNAPANYLTPAEEANYRARQASGTPDQKLQVLHELGAFGPASAKAVMQVTKHDPVMQTAGGLLGTAWGAATARDMIEGSALVKAAGATVLHAPERKAELDAYTGNALRFFPGMKAAIGPATDALAAARENRAGIHDYRSARYLANANAALGAFRGADGVVRGGIGSWRGEKVVLPPAVSQAEFEAAAHALPEQIAKFAHHPTYGNGQPVPPDVLRRTPLVAVGTGLYRYLSDPATGAVFTTHDGTPFTVRIGHQ